MLGIIIGRGRRDRHDRHRRRLRKASIDLIQNMGSNMLSIFNGGGMGSNTRFGPLGLGSMAVLEDTDARSSSGT